MDEHARQTMQDAVSNQNVNDKSFDADEMNATGEISKMSGKDDTASKSKQKTATDQVQPESIE